MPNIGSAAPAVLIARIAAATSTLLRDTGEQSRAIRERALRESLAKPPKGR